MAIDIFTDGHDQLLEVFEDAVPQAVMGNVAEEAFHHVEPGSRGGCEAHVESLMFPEPALHSLMFVG